MTPLTRLVKSGSTASLEADTARSALATAKAQLKLAETVVDQLQVMAPFPGVLDDVLVEAGSYVQDGAPVASLLQLDPIVARGEISERDIGMVAPGSRASVRLISGRQVQGTVRYISRQGSGRTRTFPVEVEIPNPDFSISAGMTSEITLQGASVSTVFLPRSGVTLLDSGELGVRTLDRDNHVGFVPIDLIDDTPDGLYLAGIAPDARIIVAGQDLVSDGDRVEAVEADSTAQVAQ